MTSHSLTHRLPWQPRNSSGRRAIGALLASLLAIVVQSRPHADAAVVFSYNATTGQLPTAQGWSFLEVDTTGPLTGPSVGGAVTGTSAANSNLALELVEGVNTLHLRDTINETAFDLPTVYYPWTTGQQQQLLDNGLKFTLVAQVLTNTASNSNLRFGFNGTEFEIQNDNINADQTLSITNFGTTGIPLDGAFHTLTVLGQKNGTNFDFTISVDGGPASPLTPITNPAPAAIESTVYFGGLSSAGRNSDLLVRSAVMETLGVLPDQTATIVRTPGNPYGSLTLKNNAGPLTIAGYSVLSNGGALNPANWTSVDATSDLSGNGSVDPNDEWTTLTGPTQRDNLSEFEPDCDGATLTTGQSIALGNVWIQNPNEDVRVELLLTDGTIKTLNAVYSGNGGERFDFGDLDFDGDFDVTDFSGKFVATYGSSTATKSGAEKYQAGDFNSDGAVDLTDFLLYSNAYSAANPSLPALDGALLSVPEPAAGMMALLAACGVTLTRRRASNQPRLIGRHRSRRSNVLLALFAPIVVQLGASRSAQAATRIAHWKFDEAAAATTAVDAVGAAHNATKFGNATSGSAGVIGGAWNFGGTAGDYLSIATEPSSDALLTLGQTFSVTAWVNTSATTLASVFSISDDTEPSEEVLLRAAGDQGATGFGSADVNARVNGGFGIDSAEAVSVTHVNNAQWHFLSFAQNPTGWSLYVDGVLEDSGVAADGLAHAAAIGANVAHIGINKDNTAANSGYQWPMNGRIDDLVVWSDRLTTTEVQNLHLAGLNGVDAGTPFTAKLTLEVNESNGNVKLKNASGFGFEIDAYRIRSTGGSLTPGTWTTLDAQSYDANSWTRLDNQIAVASEGTFGDSSILMNAMTPLDLGALYDETKNLKDLVLEYHVVGTGVTTLYAGAVSYVTGGGLAADFNGDNDVDGADFLVWQRGLGVGTTKAQGDANGSGSVTGADLTIWRNTFGSVGATPSVQGVPEPAAFALLMLAAPFAVNSVRHNRRRRQVTLHGAILCVAVAAAASEARATVFVDRLYRFGDDAAEGASNTAVLGSGNGFGTTFDSANDPGPGDLQDLTVAGNPKYILVNDRPGATAGSLGAAFDGDGDYVFQNANFAVPSQVWDDPEYFTSYPLNYEGINVQGMQMWVKPDATRQNVRQDIVKNSGEHGISITASNHWGLVADVETPIDSGVPVAFGQWAHVMHVSGINNLQSGASMSGGALFVNGVIATAQIATYEYHNTQPMTFGGQQLEGSLSPAPTAPEHFFKGVIDDASVFLWGTNTSSFNYGTFSAGTDNAWIASQLVGIHAGDVNRDGVVSGDGSGPATSDDVRVLVDNWRYAQRWDGVALGDWNSRIRGDLNLDGIVDLKDAFTVRQGLIASGLGSLDLAQFAIPEPATGMLAAMFGVVGLGLRRRLAGSVG
jgi:hypothetical protein